ncbi:hypothetical protein HNQ69_001098 [Bartonella callosciuri]|uniref:Uncharacterized protein n=1 Tax=Bartonella callosciuri TaxID=686223 RepID=A0A840NVJ6_9HYPH|nr:hypothetical protein [Bartonella callosciuri]
MVNNICFSEWKEEWGRKKREENEKCGSCRRKGGKNEEYPYFAIADVDNMRTWRLFTALIRINRRIFDGLTKDLLVHVNDTVCLASCSARALISGLGKIYV